MRLKPPIVLMLAMFLGPNFAVAQYYPSPSPPCPPGPIVYPFPHSRTTPLQTLLYVRIAGPEGMKVTFYRGPFQAITLDAPCQVGMRPGYFYRVALSGMKAYPGRVFYPTLEVRGSLLLGGSLRAVDYPAGLVFREQDFTQALDGSMIKKVVFVEKVEEALPKASSPDNPIELTVPSGRDPLVEARERGLPVLLVEMGQKDMLLQELLACAIPGTLFLPGDAYLPRPSQIPCLPWSCYPLYDPILGPAPWLYYTLPDGGDWGPRAGFDNQGRLRGVDPADTVASFVNAQGRQQLAVSNRVCLCIPRFLVAKSETPLPARLDSAMTLRAAQINRSHLAMDSIRSPREHVQEQHLERAQRFIRVDGKESVQGTAVTGRLQNLSIKATVTGPGIVTGVPPKQRMMREPELPPDEAPLKVDKWPDCCGGVVGSVITFFIRYTHVGRHPIDKVVVTDNLISRFEYVPGSAKTSRAANFTTQPNNVGSTIVRWEIEGTLRPGETGTVSFQVRIR